MRLLFSVFFVLLFTFTTFSQTTRLPTEFESWNEVQLIAPLRQGKDAKGKNIDKITATFNSVFRLGRKDIDFLDNRVGAALDFRVNRYFSLTAATLYRWDENVKNVRRYETRFDTGGSFSETFRKFTFRARSLYEHRFRNSRADLNAYRQRIQANRPIKYQGKELFTPFISEEGYYDLRTKKWFRNEFYIGITRKLNKKVSLDIAFVHTDTRPTNVNALNLVLKYKLK